MKGNMNRIVKLVAVIAAVGVLIAGGTFGVLTYRENVKEAAAAKDFVATVNGVGICRSEFELAKRNAKNNGADLTEKDVLFKLIVNEAILQEAKKQGYTVTETEAEKATENQMKRVHESASYDRLKEMLKEAGISEKAYWKAAKTRNLNASIRNRYKDELKVEYAKENQIKDPGSLETKFGDYFEEVTSEIMSVADIEVLIKL